MPMPCALSSGALVFVPPGVRRAARAEAAHHYDFACLLA
jgi:hypothetical protein